MTWVCTECGPPVTDDAPPLRCRACGDSSFIRWQSEARPLDPDRKVAGCLQVRPTEGFPNGGLLSPLGLWS